LDDYKDVFDGLGLIGKKCSIVTDESIRPVIHAYRKIPFALKPLVKKKLEEMEK